MILSAIFILVISFTIPWISGRAGLILLFVASVAEQVRIPIYESDISLSLLVLAGMLPAIFYKILSLQALNKRELVWAAMTLAVVSSIMSLGAINNSDTLVNQLKLLAFLIAGLWCFRESLNHENEGLIITLVALTAGTSLLSGCYEFIMQSSHRHFSGGFNDWNYFAIYAVGWLPLLWKQAQRHSAKRNYIYGLMALHIALALLSQSRTGTALLFFGLVYIVIIWKTGEKGIYLPFIITLTLLFLSPILLFLLSDHQLTAKILQNPRIQERLFNWSAALTAFSDNPFWGAGTYQYSNYLSDIFSDVPFSLSRHYSGFMTAMVEWGLFGVIAFGWILYGSSFEMFFNKDSNSRKISHYHLVSTLMLLGIAFLLYPIQDHLFTWIFLGLLNARLLKTHD